MATGLRVMSADPEHANKTIVIQDHSRIMGHNGQPKTYPIALDAEASCIVSEGVWAELRKIMAACPEMPTLILVGHVESPPTLRAGEGVGRPRPTVLWTASGAEVDIAPIIVPTAM